MHTGTSFPPVPACRTLPTNQQGDNQCVGIFAGSVELYGRKAEVSLMGYFLEWKVTGVQSALGLSGRALMTGGGRVGGCVGGYKGCGGKTGMLVNIQNVYV